MYGYKNEELYKSQDIEKHKNDCNKYRYNKG